MAPTTKPPASESLSGFRVVQRTIMPPDGDLDIQPLYIAGMTSLAGGVAPSRQSGTVDSDDQPMEAEEATAAPVGLTGYGQLTDTGVAVASGRRMTFGTYFNAFPAGYWRRWTDCDRVRLSIQYRGTGHIIILRSTSKGHIQRSEVHQVDASRTTTLDIDLPLKPFIDGGWYWFDVAATTQALVVDRAVWAVPSESESPTGSISIGITTMNRPKFCVDQLFNLLDHPEVLAIVDEVYVVDQGKQKVVDEPRYDEVAERLGERLQLIEQGNVGGSGGFSRSMMETMERGKSDYCLLLDDDVVCETEGILRAVALADLAKDPTLVGGQMLSLYHRTVLHAYGETVEKYRWFWGPAPYTHHGLNFADQSLRTTPWLHRRIDVDYNGWWMCLIPVRVIREIGLSLPMFLKWDDAEFGLRAKAAGYPTVTMPGVAVWHVPWHEKDDTIDWQAYFHRRNRIIAALLHSPYPHGGRLVWESFETQVKHLLSMQYGPAEMGLMAIEDILEGPQRMHRDLMNRLPELRALRKGYDDSRSRPGLDQFPAPQRRKPPRFGKDPAFPGGRFARVRSMATGSLRQLLAVDKGAAGRPEIGVPHLDAKWWLLSHFDSALVSSADGTSASWYRRDPELFRDILQRSVSVHTRLLREWAQLSRTYRDAASELSSPQAWKATFDQSSKSPSDEAGAGGANG